jgi:2-polyprenyl-6-methoxyphenol hydroxylase-like FAD-dependent oxidoreductase
LRKAGISVAVYERDSSALARTQGYRFHLDTRGEQALRECLPPSLYELFLATRGQPSRGGTLFSNVDGQLKEVATRHLPEHGAFVTVGRAVDRLTLRQILLAGLDDAMHFGKEFTRYEQLPDGTVCAYFADGTEALGDVLVGACGVNSRVRGQLLPHAEMIDTGMRWLGGKALLTHGLRSVLPAQLAETFGFFPDGVLNMVFGLVTFGQDPNQAAAHLYPGLRFQATGDYVFWGVLVKLDQLAVSDDALLSMSGSELQRLVLSLGAQWPEALRMFIEQCEPDQTFVLRMRHAKPVAPWETVNITLLGDAIHAMLPTGSGANTALRDASLLTRSLSTVVSGGVLLQRALYDYESEMVRYGFEALEASLRQWSVMGEWQRGSEQH